MSPRAVSLALLMALASSLSAAQPSEVVISAATSLTDVLQQLAPMYESRFGDRLVLNIGPSNTLARQIASGARVDVFVSADAAQMDRVEAEIVQGTRIDLLSNVLAIAVPDDRPAAWTSARQLAEPSVKRIAIGDPAAVPAGVYAKQYLEQIGIWPLVESRLVPTPSVRLALAAVENGAADAALVYRTDIAVARRAREAFAVPLAQGPKIVYPAALLRTGANPAGGRRLLAFLGGPEAEDVFRRAGFVPLVPQVGRDVRR